ncbi:carboxypeptidase Y-deficient [Coemansia sp. RSA 2704]|nr:carboxypeptidase Y-deficient [Coemansia sp. RSA 2704]
MSQSSSPLHREASQRHVRRAARTLGPVPTASAAGSPGSSSIDTAEAAANSPLLITRAARSQSTSAGGDVGQLISGGGRRSTISLGVQSSPLAGGRRASGAAAEGDALRCPICGVVAPSLFALNVHLDDMHFASEGGAPLPSLQAQHPQQARAGAPREAAQDDLEEVKGAILGFFRGAGRAVRGLGGAAPVSEAANDAGSDDVRVGGDRWASGEPDGADRGLVTRAHWQQMRAGARCGEPACGAVLGSAAAVSAVNCRCCGRLMCAQHSARRLRLSATAQVARRGALCRVCNDCAARAAGPTAGQTRDHTRGFVHLRRRTVNVAVLEGNRIEKRLEKLALVHGERRQQTALVAAAAGARRALQEAEQSVVVWEDDAAAAACPFCERTFGRLATRRHHCRLCGRVVCARPGCSALLSVPLPRADGRGFSETERADIRACRECEHVVLRHRDRVARAAPQAVELSRLYAHIRASMARVEETLPTFNALAMRLRDGGAGTAPDLPRAARIRKQLTVAFGEMDQASKRVVALPAASTGDARLHGAIRRAVAQYLQLHMFPLTMLPKQPRRPPRMLSPDQTPLRIQMASTSTSSAELVESPAASLPSSISTVNIDGIKPPSVGSDAGSASFEGTTANGSNDSPVRESARAGSSNGAQRAGLASSLLAYVIPAKPRSAAETQHDERIREALADDPGKEQRIAAMAAGEKLASLEVLRDQRQRVLGYISEAQKERRLEDAASLQASLTDLDVELSLIERSL